MAPGADSPAPDRDDGSEDRAPEGGQGDSVEGPQGLATDRGHALPDTSVQKPRWLAGAGVWLSQVVSPLAGFELEARRQLGATPLVVSIALLGATDTGWLRAATLDVQFLGVTGALCHQGWRSGAWSFAPCAFALGSWLKVEEGAIDHPRAAGRAWAAVGAGGDGGWAFSRRAQLRVSLRLGPALVRRRFSTELPERQVGETPPVLAIVSLGVGWEF